MKKCILVVLSFLLFSPASYSQLIRLDVKAKDGIPFKSIFHTQQIKRGDFAGALSGALYLQKNGEDSIIPYTFHREEALLNIVHDPNMIYDVSYKNYKFARQDIQLRYTTYATANRLEVILGEDTYSYNVIDGCCCMAMNGLEWGYTLIDKQELLFLYASKDIGLWKVGIIPSSYVIKAGSVLCFAIDRKRKKDEK